MSRLRRPLLFALALVFGCALIVAGTMARQRRWPDGVSLAFAKPAEPAAAADHGDSSERIPSAFLQQFVTTFRSAIKARDWSPLRRYAWVPLMRFNPTVRTPASYPRGYLVCPRAVGPFFRGLIAVADYPAWKRLWRLELSSARRILRTFLMAENARQLPRKFHYDAEHGYRPGLVLGNAVVIYPAMDEGRHPLPDDTPEIRYLIHTPCEKLWQAGIPRLDEKEEWRLLATLFVVGSAGDACAEGACIITKPRVESIVAHLRAALERKSWAPLAEAGGSGAFDLRCQSEGMTRTVTVDESSAEGVWKWLLEKDVHFRALREEPPRMEQTYLETVGPRAGELTVLGPSQARALLVFDLVEHGNPLLITDRECGSVPRDEGE